MSDTNIEFGSEDFPGGSCSMECIDTSRRHGKEKQAIDMQTRPRSRRNCERASYWSLSRYERKQLWAPVHGATCSEEKKREKFFSRLYLPRRFLKSLLTNNCTTVKIGFVSLNTIDSASNTLFQVYQDCFQESSPAFILRKSTDRPVY